MASPVRLFIAPNTGIELKIQPVLARRKSTSTSRSAEETASSDPLVSYGDPLRDAGIVDPNYVRHNWDYFLTKEDQFNLKLGAEFSSVAMGRMSPIYNVTLTPHARQKAGIHKTASRFAYLHPPKGLANKIDWKSYHFSKDDGSFKTMNCIYETFEEEYDPAMPQSKHQTKDKVESDPSALNYSRNAWAAPFLSIYGAFVYFDDDLRILEVNVITLRETDFHLNLNGPYRTPTSVINEVSELNRMEVYPLDAAHENSYVATAWVCPNETFASGVSSCPGLQNIYGSFIYVRYDGTAETYRVDLDLEVNFDGDSSILSDILSSKSCQFSLYETLADGGNFASQFIDDAEAVQWKKYITSLCNGSFGRSKQGNVVKSTSVLAGKSLIHAACRAKVHLKYIELLLLEYPLERLNLLIKDSFGWNPLHYACAFSADDEDLIRFLVEQEPRCIFQADIYGRYPLHIACDNEKVQSSMVELLLGSEEKLILKTTKYFKRSPLMIALDRGQNAEIIEILLKEDKNLETIRAVNDVGTRPIHSALRKKLPPETIRLLLDADSKLCTVEDDKDADIFSDFCGMRPIHIACQTGASPETVALLLDKDVEGVTLNPYAKEREEELSSTKYLQQNDYIEGKIPLHLALERRSTETILLLLKRAEVKGDSTAAIFHVDKHNQNALHMACKHNCSPEIIKALIHIDLGMKTIKSRDVNGRTPIHYACELKEANPTTVKLLLDAEKKMNKNTSDSKNRAHVKSPFWYAVKSEAPDAVLEILMKDPSFSLNGFDSSGMRNDLAERINSCPALQILLINRLASRMNNVRLMLKLFSDVLMLALFFSVTEGFANGSAIVYQEAVMIGCVSIFVLIEVYQLYNQRWNYFIDLSNWYDMPMIVVVIYAIWILRVNRDYCSEEEFSEVDYCLLPESYFASVLILSGLLMGINVIRTLRGIFLPFALFATGLENILTTLVPFFVVSFLLLVSFTETYRIEVNFTSRNFDEETAHGACKASFGSCLLVVLQGFFVGPDSTTGVTDIIYGVTVAIILLNVVIAIVSDSWEDSKRSASRAFWRTRVTRLFELGNTAALEKTLWIDKIKWTNWDDGIVWSKDAPYNKVKERAQFDKPNYYFDPPVAEMIEGARSLASRQYWIKKEPKKGFGMVHVELLSLGLLYILNQLGYIVLILLGVPSFGLSWPNEFSRGFYAWGIRGKEEKRRGRIGKEEEEGLGIKSGEE